MWDQPADEALAWAEICLDHPWLEGRARRSGHLGEFGTLTEAARAGVATLAGWRELIARIERHERARGDSEIRDRPDDEYPEPDDEPPTVAYGCPDGAHPCSRTGEADGSLAPPLCHLTGKGMLRRSESA